MGKDLRAVARRSEAFGVDRFGHRCPASSFLSWGPPIVLPGLADANSAVFLYLACVGSADLDGAPYPGCRRDGLGTNRSRSQKLCEG
jgi:hypothetical protein